MSRVILRKLVFTGTNKEPAVLEFQPGFNVITGPSNTGKSLIFECINYVLGGTEKPKAAPEAQGYTNIFLTISFDNKFVTIERSTLSNDVRVFDTGYETIKNVEPKILSGSAQANISLSDFLMEIFGIKNKKLKKNESNQVISLTFNVLKNLILIDEGKIQSKISPILSGLQTSQTSDKSLLKFIITGTDYSGIVPEIKPEIRKADATARINILKQLIDESANGLNDSTSIDELNAQKLRLEATIENEIVRISNSQLEIESLQTSRKIAWDDLIRIESILDQRKEILDRFKLLTQHYQTDLERLEASIETGELLALSKDVDCPLCGAKSEYHRPECVVNETEILKVKEACEFERTKIVSLQHDLRDTILQVTSEIVELTKAKEQTLSEYQKADHLITNKLTPSLTDLKKNLQVLFEQKTKIELMVGTKTNIRTMEELMVSATEDLQPRRKQDKTPSGVQAVEVTDLLKHIQSTLKDWEYPNPDTIGFSETLQDITIGNQNRIDQGKGFRAVSCAAFIISLMEFCIEKNIPHPGFTVLDSPLVTFKGADKKAEDIEIVSDDTKNSFYISLSKMKKDRQVIILENDDPPGSIISSINYIHFTKDKSLGRYGFIPE